MASSSTSTLSDEVTWEELPEELLRRVLGQVMQEYKWKGWRGAVRGVSRRWRAVHDAVCQRLRVQDGVTDEVMHALCGRLPVLTDLSLREVTSLTEDGLRAVGGLTTLTTLYLYYCSNVTDAVLRELRDLTALTTLHLSGCTCTRVTDVGVWELRDLTTLTVLHLYGCPNVTDVGIRHLSSLTALTRLRLYNTSTTQAGRNALKAALPALTIYWF